MKNTPKKKSASFKLIPLGDKVILKEIKGSEGKKTESGIYIPDTVKEDKGSKRGTVVAVGEGRFEDGNRIPVCVSVGDEVLFQWGDQIIFDGEEYFIVREGEISAVVKGN